MAAFLKTFLKYLLWGMTPEIPILSSAIGQQAIVFSAVWFLPLHPIFQYCFACLIFAVVFHIPNLPLIILTYIFAAVFYPFVFFYGPETILAVSLLHALSGTILHRRGFDLKVWNF